MHDQDDSKHERVVFIDDATKEPVMTLYRKTEKFSLVQTFFTGPNLGNKITIIRRKVLCEQEREVWLCIKER